MRGLPRGRPRAAGQRRYPASDRQVHPLDERRIHPAGPAQRLQRFFKGFPGSQPHHLLDLDQFASPMLLLHLTVEQACLHLPLRLPLPAPNGLDPLPKMGGQRVEIGVDPIAGEDWQTPRSQEGLQTVDQQVRHVVGARAQLEHRNAFGERIKGHSEPQHLRVAPQARAHLIQLDVRNPQVTEGALV